jgi:hypothetical protein
MTALPAKVREMMVTYILVGGISVQCIHMAGLLGVITRLRVVPASLRDPPKSRLDIYLSIQGSDKRP